MKNLNVRVLIKNNLYNLNITRQRHEKQNKNKVRSGNANVINNKVNKIK